MLCINCRQVEINLSRIKNKDKIYKNKGYKISVTSQFKSSQEILSSMISDRSHEDVRYINPTDLKYTPQPINKYDKAKIMARKYKHLSPDLLRLSRAKITSDKQVDFINDIVFRIKSSPKS